MSDSYASGNWVVKGGHESDFIQRWVEFLEWSRAAARGLQSAQLIQDADDPRHFISFASWESSEAMATWRLLPDFAAKLSACRSLCEDFRGSSYTVAAKV